MAGLKVFKVKDAEEVITVSSNAKNSVNNINAADGVFDGDVTSLDKHVASQSLASTVVTGAETAAVVAPEALTKVTPLLGKSNVVLTTWGARNDIATIESDYNSSEEYVKASSVLSLGSNIAGGLAGGAAVAAGLGVTVVGAPVIVALGGASFALWGASMVVGDISANDAIVNGLGDIGTAGIVEIQRAMKSCPPHELDLSLPNGR